MTKFDLSTTDTSKLVSKQTLKKSQPLTLYDLNRPAVSGKTIILADISGSMDSQKMTCLKDALTKAWRPGVEGIAFESQLWAFDKTDIQMLYARGTTHMAEALTEAWGQNPQHIILLTDGQPDGGAQEIVVLVKSHLRPPIDTVAIGDPYGRSCDKDLLREIARLTGGKFTDVGDPLQLTHTLCMLLDFKHDELTQKGGSIML